MLPFSGSRKRGGERRKFEVADSGEASSFLLLILSPVVALPPPPSSPPPPTSGSYTPLPLPHCLFCMRKERLRGRESVLPPTSPPLLLDLPSLPPAFACDRSHCLLSSSFSFFPPPSTAFSIARRLAEEGGGRNTFVSLRQSTVEAN